MRSRIPPCRPNGNGNHRFNSNSYISIGLVVLLIGGIIWIKDGQYKTLDEANSARKELAQYKELQLKEAEILKAKMDAIVAVNGDHWSATDAKNAWKQFKALNPQLKIPDL